MDMGEKIGINFPYEHGNTAPFIFTTACNICNRNYYQKALTLGIYDRKCNMLGYPINDYQ